MTKIFYLIKMIQLECGNYKTYKENYKYNWDMKKTN